MTTRKVERKNGFHLTISGPDLLVFGCAFIHLFSRNCRSVGVAARFTTIPGCCLPWSHIRPRWVRLPHHSPNGTTNTPRHGPHATTQVDIGTEAVYLLFMSYITTATQTSKQRFHTEINTGLNTDENLMVSISSQK